MEKTKHLIVSLKFSEDEVEVGELVSDKRSIYFKFYSSFIQLNLTISPFKLKLNNTLHTTTKIPFDKLFGVFNDSLPDGWGRLLLDRKLLLKGIHPDEIGPLDRLSFVGDNGMGALIYKPKQKTKNTTASTVKLHEIEVDTQKVYDGCSEEILTKLFSAGGSSGGARPKINVGYNPKTGHLILGKNNLPNNFEHWLIKFKSSTDLDDISKIEFAYYKMALDCGIEMAECKLFLDEYGKSYFGTKRFDRGENNSRVHLHSVSGLLHDDFRKSSIDYGHIMDCAFNLENDVRVYEKILTLAAFNVYAHNKDDHSKNFSFLMDAKGVWRFAPAYDLTFSASTHGQQSTTVFGKGENIGEADLINLAMEFNVKNINSIIFTVKSVCQNWNKYADEAKVSLLSKKIISNRINELLKI